MRSFVKFISIGIARDIRNTLRIWRRNPGTTLAAYLALTVGIGATTTIFSVLSSLLLSPLPIRDADRVVWVNGLNKSGQNSQLSLPDALDAKARLRSVDSFAVYRRSIGNLVGRTQPAMVHILEADTDLFKVMGLKMAQGTVFARDANEPGHSCELVISWPFWQSRFGGANVIGQNFRLNEQPCIIDGVLPRQMNLPAEAEVWLAAPFALNAPANRRRIKSWFVMAHLANNASSTTLNAELASVSRQLSSEHPDEDSGLRIEAIPIRDWLTKGVRKSLLILLVAVAGVLMLACANVANLLLARSSARLREISVRLAVGASRVMLFQQMMTESILLALAAGLSGVVLTLVAIRMLREMPDVPIPRPDSIVIDWRVMLFAVTVAVITGVLFGSLPALRVSRTALTGVLSQAGGRISESRNQQLIRRLLVGAETAIATVLLIASLLLLRSFSEVSRINVGFQTQHLLTAYVSLAMDRYRKDTMDTVHFADKVLANLKRKPGIEAATIAASVPLQNSDASGLVQIEGKPVPMNFNDSPTVLNTGVTPSFRSTLKMKTIAGRDLNELDDRDGTTSLLVNAAFVKRFFPDGNAVGKRLRFSPMLNPTGPWYQVVGVLGNVPQNGFESEVEPELFMPLSASVSPYPAVMIRTADNAMQHLHDLVDAVHQADPDVPVFQPRTMEQVEARQMGLRTFNTSLISLFACIALTMACGGIFAVIAYSVSQRTSEIGVRMACGASQADIVWMIMRQALVPAFVGIACGVLISFGVNHFLESLLFGVKTTDITAHVVTVIMLAMFSALAALVPARRAARVQPWRALRHE